MFVLIVFTCGYLVGGFSALFIVGLALASQRSDIAQRARLTKRWQ
jgi:hypothetical protein